MRTRLTGAWIHGVVQGGIHVFSIYLQDGVGFDDGNLEVLHELAAILMTIDTPWVVAGDFNNVPKKLMNTGWTRLVRGTIIAPEQATCHDNVYDYFVVSPCIAHTVHAVQTIAHVGLGPHHSVRI